MLAQVVLFNGGKEIAGQAGAITGAALTGWIASHIPEATAAHRPF